MQTVSSAECAGMANVGTSPRAVLLPVGRRAAKPPGAIVVVADCKVPARATRQGLVGHGPHDEAPERNPFG